MTRFLFRRGGNRVSRTGACAAGALRSGASLTTLLGLALLLSLWPSPHALCGDKAARVPAASADPLHGCTIVRCLFDEGRIVLSHQGKLYVLRPGDEVPGGDLAVASITPRQVVLRERGKAQDSSTPGPSSGAVVLITEKPGSGWDVKVLRGASASTPQLVPMPAPSQAPAAPAQKSSKSIPGAGPSGPPPASASQPHRTP